MNEIKNKGEACLEIEGVTIIISLITLSAFGDNKETAYITYIDFLSSSTRF